MPASQFGGSANRVRRQVTGTMSTGPIPTFFDGTYHPEAAAGSRKPKAQLHPAPAWRYLYNSALLVLDAAMMLIACGLVFLISGNVLHTVQQEISGGVPRTLVVLCVVWLLSLAVCQGYARHVMGEGYGVVCKGAERWGIRLFRCVFAIVLVRCTIPPLAGGAFRFHCWYAHHG